MAAKQDSVPVTLGRLLPARALAPDVAAIEVGGLRLDSRAVEPGDVFVAMDGETVDGRQFIVQAVERGAVAVIAEGIGVEPDVAVAVPVVPVENLAGAVSEIANIFYREPSHGLLLAGITGTNGKTTCSQLLVQLYGLMGIKTGVIGTLGYGVVGAGNESMSLTVTGFTTPDAVATQRILAEFATQQALHVAMEVSSHSLSQGRVAAVQFDTAVFTNLSRDHLDYHGDMAAYALAKQQLFLSPELKHAVINIDDPWGAALLEELPKRVDALRYAVDNTDADIYLRNANFSAAGVTADIVTPWGSGHLHSVLLGKFNLSNLLAVIGAACCQGAELSQILSLVPKLAPVEGRMQALDVNSDIRVIVDYAHTPDALAKTLDALRAHNSGQLWCVFGCGGDRDRGKRGEMGALAVQHADRVVVTSDNPRTESPAAIIADVVADKAVRDACNVVEDRAAAIAFAIVQAKAGDTVLLAGKGHEDYQLVGNEVLPFSDVAQARLALREREAGR